MNKILGITLILATLLASTFLVTPTVSASLGDGKNCCSWDQSIVSGCMSQGYIQWKMCIGFNADVSIERYYGFNDF